MSFLINTPPTLDGDNERKIQLIYKHLYEMSEQVNYALNALASGEVYDTTGTLEARKNIASALGANGNSADNSTSLQTYNELKSLIIKTGNAVNESMASFKVVYDEALVGVNNSINNVLGDINSVSNSVNALKENDIANLFSKSEALQNLYETVNSLSQTNSQSIDNLDGRIDDEVDTLTQTISSSIDTSKTYTDEQLQPVQSGLSETQLTVSGLQEVSVQIQDAFGVGSEYGSYAEAISNKMSLSAEGVVQKYELVSKLEAADDKAAGFAEWINLTDEYIKTGFLYTDENGLKRVGVAIGTNIAASIVDGKIQQNAKTDLLATFVSDTLIFWQGGQKVAYMSNKKLYILSAEFLGSYIIGKFQWEYTDDLGLVLKFLN